MSARAGIATAVAAALLAGGGARAALADATADSVTAWTTRAITLYNAKDFAGFLTLEQRALDAAPGTPRLLYNVACGEALVGHAAQAVVRLDELLAMKIDLGAADDADFGGIHTSPEWTGYLARLAALRKPLVASRVAITLADPGLVVTGVTIDAATGDTYIASARERKILKHTRAGVVSDFITTGQDGFLGGASLAIDAPRHLLYATTSAIPIMAGYGPLDFGRSGVYAFDLRTAKLVRKAMLGGDGRAHFLNALVVDHAGDVYISDSAEPVIHVLRRGVDTLAVFLPAGTFRATQGLALSADEKTLYVVDFADGVWALDMASRERRALAPPPGVWLGGLDGISSAPGGLIAVQIGVRPERVLRLKLDPARTRITSATVLEMSHPDYAGPIQGVVDRDAYVYIANSQLNLANMQTGAFALDRARPTELLRLPLGK